MDYKLAHQAAVKEINRLISQRDILLEAINIYIDAQNEVAESGEDLTEHAEWCLRAAMRDANDDFDDKVYENNLLPPCLKLKEESLEIDRYNPKKLEKCMKRITRFLEIIRRGDNNSFGCQEATHDHQ